MKNKSILKFYKPNKNLSVKITSYIIMVQCKRKNPRLRFICQQISHVRACVVPKMYMQ